MLYFIVRKWKSTHSESYRIEKHTEDLAEANKFLAALSLLETDDWVSFKIVPYQDVLVLTKEMEVHDRSN